MEMSGREYSIDEVMREIEKETVFMNPSCGGYDLVRLAGYRPERNGAHGSFSGGFKAYGFR